MIIMVHPGFVNERLFAGVCKNYLIGDQGLGCSPHRILQRIIEI